MAATFFDSAHQPGDGAWLLQQNYNRRGRRHNKIKSFLSQIPDERDEAETNMHASKQIRTMLGPSHDNGQERTSFLIAPDHDLNDVPRTIANQMPLSHEASLQSQDQPQLISFLSPKAEPTYTFVTEPTTYCSPNRLTDDTMVQPPHLRNKITASSLSNTGKGEHVAEPLAPANSNVKRDHEATPSLKNSESQNERAGSPHRTGGVDIRRKLQDEFAVKVSDPQPANSITIAKPALVPDPSSNEDDDHAPNGHVRDFPTKTISHKPRARPAVSPHGDRSNENRTGQHSSRGHGQSGRGGGSGRGLQNHPPRDSRWPTTAETRADPHRWDQNRDWDSSSDSIDSDCADPGFGDRVGKKGRKHRDDGIDSETGFQLADWSGNWAPPPENWDGRPAFSNRRQTPDRIDRWMSGIDEAMCGKDWAIPNHELNGTGLVAASEFAPRYWVPVVVGNEAPQIFWKELVESTKPKPIDEGDLDGVSPWWKCYQVQGGNALKPYEHQQIMGIDPDEKSEERIARENDYGSSQHAENRKRTERAKREHQRDRRKRAEEKARKISDSSQKARSLHIIKPGISLYIRSANPSDIPSIRQIYNYYVDNSACTPETERRTTSDILLRYNDILANGLPFLVACERGGKLKGRRRKNEEEVVLPDKVVGFATADDYNDMRGMYRFTADMEVFVDKDYYMKGVAKCLLDKLTALLDPDYVERGGYDIQGEELEGAGVGASRVIKNVIIHIPYDNPNRVEWLGRWLKSWLGFKQVDDLENVGNKNGRSVNLAIFQRTTGSVVNAAQPPIMMQYPS